MRKFFAGLAIALMLVLSTVAYAQEGPYLWSPSGNIIIPPPDPDGDITRRDVPPGGGKIYRDGDGYGERSPKTGDINILLVESLGAAAAVTAVVTRKKRHA